MADKRALRDYFGADFGVARPLGTSSIESIPKRDVYDELKAATRRCQPKGTYNKRAHSFEILAKINPRNVMDSSPHAKRLIETLLAKATE